MPVFLQVKISLLLLYDERTAAFSGECSSSFALIHRFCSANKWKIKNNYAKICGINCIIILVLHGTRLIFDTCAFFKKKAHFFARSLQKLSKDLKIGRLDW